MDAKFAFWEAVAEPFIVKMLSNQSSGMVLRNSDAVAYIKAESTIQLS
jgi:hypothetical protein